MATAEDIGQVQELRFIMSEKQAAAFSSILQGGFLVRCKTGIAIADLLGDAFGISREYMERRLSTVFLNGQCIDDIDKQVIQDKGVLALSSAMPGLAGATLRRKGVLASMRSSITGREGIQGAMCAKDGFITVKLFNVLAGELGPLFLARGIYVETSRLADFLKTRGGSFWSAAKDISLNGQQVNSGGLIVALCRNSNGFALLTVSSA